MRAGHRVRIAAHVAFAEDDLEEIGLPAGGPEHLRAADEIGAPDAQKAFVETFRVHRLDGWPVGLEFFCPGVQRQRVVAAQVFNVQDFQAFPFQCLQSLR